MRARSAVRLEMCRQGHLISVYLSGDALDLGVCDTYWEGDVSHRHVGDQIATEPRTVVIQQVGRGRGKSGTHTSNCAGTP